MGCLIAWLTLIFLKSEAGVFLNGPPDAVMKRFWIVLLKFVLFKSNSFKDDQIEKCSESTGIICVLFKIDFFFIKFHPQIIDSLFAIANYFVYLIIFKVGFKPANPTIEFIV